MSSYKKFKKQQIKDKIKQKGYMKILEDGKNDGSLMEFITHSMSEQLGLDTDGDIIDAEFTEVVDEV